MKKNFKYLVVVLAMTLVTASCHTAKSHVTHHVEHHAHWSHQKGKTGPSHWVELGDDFTACGGQAQSPIDLVTSSVKQGHLLAPKFAYDHSSIDIINNGHTVQFNVDKGNNVELGGKKYELLQFHFHALSEHTINGKHSPIEVHFVHKHSDMDFAVISMFFKEGKRNPLFDKYLAKFPKKEGSFKSGDELDLISLFPKDKSYYYYNGSLTTPPCSEVVNWYLMKTPLTASKVQIEMFSKILHNNFRPVQPMNGRVLEMYKN